MLKGKVSANSSGKIVSRQAIAIYLRSKIVVKLIFDLIYMTLATTDVANTEIYMKSN
ncbi:MAG: hypothetical protein SGI87_14330 [Flavobacteriales bacterium]|nr:hypothetical protein [Flavobacteriales bacterium]